MAAEEDEGACFELILVTGQKSSFALISHTKDKDDNLVNPLKTMFSAAERYEVGTKAAKAAMDKAMEEARRRNLPAVRDLDE